MKKTLDSLGSAWFYRGMVKSVWKAHIRDDGYGYSARLGNPGYLMRWIISLKLERDEERRVSLLLTYDELVDLRDTLNRWIDKVD